MKPLDGCDGKGLRGDAGHLNPAVSKQLHIHLFPASAEPASQNERVLVEEGLVGHLAIRKEVLVAGPHYLRLVLEFQNALVGVSNGDTGPFQLVKEGVEENG